MHLGKNKRMPKTRESLKNKTAKSQIQKKPKEIHDKFKYLGKYRRESEKIQENLERTKKYFKIKNIPKKQTKEFRKKHRKIKNKRFLKNQGTGDNAEQRIL